MGLCSECGPRPVALRPQEPYRRAVKGQKAFRDLRHAVPLERVRLSCRRRQAPQGFGTRPPARHQRMPNSLRERGSRWNATSTTAALRGSSALDADRIRSKRKTNRTGIIWRSAVRNRLQSTCTVFALTSATTGSPGFAGSDDPKSPERWKYCRIVREMRKGQGALFPSALVAEGQAPEARLTTRQDLHMAIDPGLGSLTYATEDGTIAKVQVRQRGPGSPCHLRRNPACDGRKPPYDESRQLRSC